MNENDIGFLGLGKIGRPIAERLLGSKRTMTAYDVSPEALAPFRGRAAIARSVAEVADSARVVFGCLSTLDSYTAALLGPDGLHGGCRVRLYVHLGTTGPSYLEQIAAKLAQKGIGVVDAPITGGTARAAAGSLTSILSGGEAEVESVLDLVKAYSSSVVRAGLLPGQAQAVKLINNILSAGNLALACEAMSFGVKFGIDPQTILSVVNSGTGMSDASRVKVPEQVLTGNFAYGGSTAITVKDTSAYIEENRRLGLPAPLGSVIADLYARNCAVEGRSSDMTTIARLFESMADIKIRKYHDVV